MWKDVTGLNFINDLNDYIFLFLKDRAKLDD